MDVDDERSPDELEELEGPIDWTRDLALPLERSPELLVRFVPQWAPGEDEEVDEAEREERAANVDDGTTLFVASTDDEDRYGDVVRQDWRLKNFLKNPIILDNHIPLRVVGRATSATVPRIGEDAGRLMIRVAWNDNHPDPAIRGVGHDHRNGFRNAGSVGFKAGKRTARNKLPPDHPAYKEPVKVETWWGGTIEVVGDYLEQNELWEFSSATIPANPNAAQRAYVARSGLLTVPQAAGAVVAATGDDVLRLLDDPEWRSAVAAKLWPNLEALCRALNIEQLRTPEARRVIRATLDAGPPPAPEPETNPHPLAVFARAHQLLALSRQE